MRIGSENRMPEGSHWLEVNDLSQATGTHWNTHPNAHARAHRHSHSHEHSHPHKPSHSQIPPLEALGGLLSGGVLVKKGGLVKKGQGCSQVGGVVIVLPGGVGTGWFGQGSIKAKGKGEG